MTEISQNRSELKSVNRIHFVGFRAAYRSSAGTAKQALP